MPWSSQPQALQGRHGTAALSGVCMAVVGYHGTVITV